MLSKIGAREVYVFVFFDILKHETTITLEAKDDYYSPSTSRIRT